jgi:AAA domain
MGGIRLTGATHVPVTIVTGPPGAGKTTVSARLARRQTLAVHVVGDQFFHWIASGYVPPWMPGTGRQNSAVIEAIASASARFADAGYEVFVDAVVGPWFLPHWQRAAPFPDPLRYVVLRPSLKVAASRAVNRPGPDDLVDPEPVAKVFEAFEELGVFEDHVVDTTGQTVGETVQTVEQGILAGRFVLPPDGGFDMERLALKFGIDLLR